MEGRRLDVNFKLTKGDNITFVDNAGRLTEAVVRQADNNAYTYRIYEPENNISYEIPLSEMNLIQVQ